VDSNRARRRTSTEHTHRCKSFRDELHNLFLRKAQLQDGLQNHSSKSSPKHISYRRLGQNHSLPTCKVIGAVFPYASNPLPKRGQQIPVWIAHTLTRWILRAADIRAEELTEFNLDDEIELSIPLANENCTELRSALSKARKRNYGAQERALVRHKYFAHFKIIIH
jgi:hypothetical protein